ncbi:MAG TPA: hypothetical protein VEC57_12425 [Candidatus Limnocylindrales bacterium]|nr:hypothetical protein [Candidatus Limnocylindrales bacterium]
MTASARVAAALVAAGVAAGCAATLSPSQPWQGIGLSTRQESVCAGLDDAGRCARAIEKQRWSKLDRFADRTDGVLVLELAGGKKRRFQDARGSSPSDPGTQYSLIDYVRNADSFVVFELSKQGSRHLLVRRADGAAATLDSAPVFSPDGNYFVTTSADRVSSPGAIRVYRMAANAGKPKMEWSLEPGSWGPGLPRWVDETTIQIPTNGRPQVPSTGEKVPTELTVKRSTGGVWYAVLSFTGSERTTN